MSKCKTVTLRKRKIKNGTQYSLCLDYYPGYRDNTTMKVITREALGIYIFAKPANQQERDFNARMMKKAEILRNRRYEAIFNENNGFFDKARMKGDFLAYFKELADRRNIKWQHVYKHFERFVNGKCTFEEVDVDLCRKFMEYLLNAPQTIHTNQKLHINSAAGYWSAFRAVLHTAYRDRKIKENPCPYLERVKTIPTDRVGLSAEELIQLAETPCDVPILRTAFLFSCLTGLRKSDVKPFSWELIQPEADGTLYITDRMQKTDQIVHNPIGEEALALIDDGIREGIVFRGFKESMTQAPLKRWVKAAGITKHITYHSSRHTFCSLQLYAGTDVNTVKDLAGHKNISTTQQYLDSVDSRKKDAANRITIKRKEEHP